MRLPWPNLKFLRPWNPPGTNEILGEGADNVGDLDIDGRLWDAHLRSIGSNCNNVLVRRNNVQQEGQNRHGDWAVETPGPYFAGSCGCAWHMVPLKAWPRGDRFG